MELPFAESWKIKMVEPIHKSTREQREQWLKEAHYNVFQLTADKVYIDLLTDSGTGAMSDRQWSALMMGDESYAGASSFLKLKETITKITGFDYILPTHQGRAAENVLFSYLVKQGDIVPGNSHFDTTKGHIESRHATALDCTVDIAKDTQAEYPFKGNVDIKKLEKALEENKDKIPFIIITITNNTAGGQPVSMANLREVRELADKYKKPVLFDSARFAENAYFIKVREEGYANKTIKEICLEMFKYADGMTMSAKKDGLVNIGGFIATRLKEWYEGAKSYCIMYEGYLTYGGMAGRDMSALAAGLEENTEFEMLETRIKQVEYLAKRLDEYGIPYQRPAGGHAIFLDARKILTHVPAEEFPAQTLTVELYLEAGIRGVEIGYILADRDPVTRENRFGGLDLLRLAIPRRVYTDNHMNVVAVALKNVFDRREKITRGVKITWEAEIMRHFTVQLERLQ
ncbi:beta-eliminating lyase, putative [Trichomonas vaginalis G3]|uniref:Probable beta-eliminating lyase n=3 Tax=Trichomonas vaginalis TaxID=5722 RepID=BELY_TRIV3|nr:beta-eliminating lyase [Trichomonas vaginalis G3]A2EYC4.1 RecName: Full=Probable beta-eliminating lyase [Trichomonas vaginalis G3]EAY02351.1 beta-eliminating lyase, putative [Trichomonas vaginalis G3]KAI5514045.1 beta-eliminating lyase [Trichomonas vaginalis G3]|eukprot:XP_001330618.1 beta-eliminating lyase [Trichomonas vaginalis G3]